MSMVQKTYNCAVRKLQLKLDLENLKPSFLFFDLKNANPGAKVDTLNLCILYSQKTKLCPMG